MQQAEREDDDDAPGLQARREQVFDADVRDRQRNERLDEVAGGIHDAVEAQAERDRMSDRERADLPHELFQFGTEQKQAEHEQDVIETFRDDVREAHPETRPDRHMWLCQPIDLNRAA